ncbi:MAG: aminopeptidase P N-terminal domain-containing protein [Christiangramia sp.]|nr:aminopeptidase P N-terminal domain-containing protein [Christiangramia sp.]
MLKQLVSQIFILFLTSITIGQNAIETDQLSAEFHRNRRNEVRKRMPSNTVAVFFANPVRNRSNDTDFDYHQDPDFYYLTGYTEPHSVLVLFSEIQETSDGEKYNEIIFVQERNPQEEQWNGYRLGTSGVKEKLGFVKAFNGTDFQNSGIDFALFDKVLIKKFHNDVRDSQKNDSDLFSLVESFKKQIDFGKKRNEKEFKSEEGLAAKIDQESIYKIMAQLREVKTPEEIDLIRKAVQISVMGQKEVMKALHPGMSEMEIQGIHEFVYRKYGSGFEGYPSIVGAGNNGCILHYTENSKTQVKNDLVLMDLGAEYYGYTADVTRTIPATGKFTREQKEIYNLVLKAQEEGISAAIVGNSFNAPDEAARRVITEGLIKLGIAADEKEARKYFPHGTSHYLGLDVHDAGMYGNFKNNMVITVEPGIYIPEGSDCDAKWYGIAVRIEDDILITDQGPVNLSIDAPRDPEEIEELMKEKSVLNDFHLQEL